MQVPTEDLLTSTSTNFPANFLTAILMILDFPPVYYKRMHCTTPPCD